MADLASWAVRHSVSLDAMRELRMLLGVEAHLAMPVPKVDGTPGSEARQQSLVRIEAPKNGFWLTRNNVGCLLDTTGRPVRFGLANESAAQNAVVKSGDLIGIRDLLITQAHVGQVIGQFASIEMKHQGWTYTGDKHERAQLAWVNFVQSKGGYATFATGPEIFHQK